MFREIARIEKYSVNVLTKDRLMIRYEDNLVCKYDNTTDGRQEMLSDLVEFAIEDKIIKRRMEKEIMATLVEALNAFAF